MKTQRGAALVEFAMIAIWFFMFLFLIIEFGRAFFTYNTLVEATRRGARVAAVCPASSSGINMVKKVTIFNAPSGTYSAALGMLGLSENDVTVSYLKADMTSQTTPLADTDTTKYDEIKFVQVQVTGINNSSQIGLIIPGTSLSVPVPPIVTTLPSESLGRSSYLNPTGGAGVSRRCPFP